MTQDQPGTRRPPMHVALVLCAAAAIASCASSAGEERWLDLGTWGGDSAGAIVSDTAMHLHIGCTWGDASGRIPVNVHGDFEVTGSYQLHAYPVAVGPTMPARFTGHVRDNDAIITATVTDTIEHTTVVHGPVSVRLGDDPRLGPCPICRRPIVTKRTRPPG